MKNFFMMIAIISSLNISAYNDFVTCETSSNGRNFSDESRDRIRSLSSATRQCSASRYTSDRECNANVICSDTLMVRPMIMCLVESFNRWPFSSK
jgi:hypothetical protein